MAKLDVTKLPWDSKAILSGNKDELERYLKKVILALQKIQDNTVNAVNLNSDTTSVSAGITASTTQTQGQMPLTENINEIATVANANDTVTLPVATIGRRILIINNGANTLQIFPASGDNLGAGVDTATTLASGSNIDFAAYDTTNWETV